MQTEDPTEDENMILSARKFAADSFRKDATLEHDYKNHGSVVAEQGVEHALSVAKILRENVVQGIADESKSPIFSMRLVTSDERPRRKLT